MVVKSFSIKFEAVLSQGIIDRRVLTADVDAELGLITFVWSCVGQMAKLSAAKWRTGFV